MLTPTTVSYPLASLPFMNAKSNAYYFDAVNNIWQVLLRCEENIIHRKEDIIPEYVMWLTIALSGHILACVIFPEGHNRFFIAIDSRNIYRLSGAGDLSVYFYPTNQFYYQGTGCKSIFPSPGKRVDYFKVVRDHFFILSETQYSYGKVERLSNLPLQWEAIYQGENIVTNATMDFDGKIFYYQLKHEDQYSLREYDCSDKTAKLIDTLVAPVTELLIKSEYLWYIKQEKLFLYHHSSLTRRPVTNFTARWYELSSMDDSSVIFLACLKNERRKFYYIDTAVKVNNYFKQLQYLPAIPFFYFIHDNQAVFLFDCEQSETLSIRRYSLATLAVQDMNYKRATLLPQLFSQLAVTRFVAINNFCDPLLKSVLIKFFQTLNKWNDDNCPQLTLLKAWVFRQCGIADAQLKEMTISAVISDSIRPDIIGIGIIKSTLVPGERIEKSSLGRKVREGITGTAGAAFIEIDAPVTAAALRLPLNKTVERPVIRRSIEVTTIMQLEFQDSITQLFPVLRITGYSADVDITIELKG